MKYFLLAIVVLLFSCSKEAIDPIKDETPPIKDKVFNDLFCGKFNVYKKTVYYTAGSGHSGAQEVDFNIVIGKGSTDSSLTYAGYEFHYGKHPNPINDSIYYHFMSEINSDSLIFSLRFVKDLPIDTLDIIWSQHDSDADNHYFQHTIIKIDWCSKVKE